MQDFESHQPVLTSHEFIAKPAGGSRGKQRFDVERTSSNPMDGRVRPRPDFNQAKQNFQNKQNRPPRPPKPKGFDHDLLLQGHKGQTVVVMTAEDSLSVKVIDGDRFTLLVEDSDGNRELLFKSAIESIKLPAKGAE